jgi:hypothetical protein
MDKWKGAPWLSVGTKVRVARGRNIPIGMEGVVRTLSHTGSGLKAYIIPDLSTPLPFWYTDSVSLGGSNAISVWAYNLEQA